MKVDLVEGEQNGTLCGTNPVALSVFRTDGEPLD